MITKEAIEAARSAIRYLNGPDTPWSDEQVSAVITAALAAMPAQRMLVKPLEWHAITSPREDGPPEETGDIEANTMIGEYSVCLDEDEAVSDTPLCCWGPVECIGHFDDFEAAKAAAQADYDRRIMAALESDAEPAQNYNCPCAHPSQCDSSCLTPSLAAEEGSVL